VSLNTTHEMHTLSSPIKHVQTSREATGDCWSNITILVSRLNFRLAKWRIYETRQNPEIVTGAKTKPRDSDRCQEQNPKMVTGAETKPRYSGRCERYSKAGASHSIAGKTRSTVPLNRL
jgi:hypothetical protein